MTMDIVPPIASDSAPRASNSAPATVLAGSTQGRQHVMNGQANTGDSLPNLSEMDSRCGGCQRVIDQESGGVVVAFGSRLWHVDCFRCANCKEKVSADTNLLLLTNGNPVCGDCSYQCFICKQAITEEAIMTGEESYHAHCFTCRTCKRRIDELVFAKTSQGIYCMACHNERVARSRRHAEARRQRAARKEREREEAQQREQEEAARSQANAIPQPMSTPQGPLLGSPAVPIVGGGISPHISPNDTPNSVSTPQFADHTPVPDDGGSVRRTRELSVEWPVPRATSPARLAELMPLPASPSDPAHPVSRNGPVSNGSPQGKGSQQQGTPIIGSLPLGESMSSPTFGQSPSRSGNAGLGVGPVSMGSTSGLGVPTTKAERRRSINPGMSFNIDPQNSTFAAEPRMSPLPPSPLRASFTDLQAELQPRSPISPSRPQAGADGFPFRSTSAGTGTPQADDTPAPDGVPPIPVAKSATGSTDHDGISLNTPKIQAPSIRPMSFSLSDPDFALILNHIDKDHQRLDDRSEDTARPDGVDEVNGHSQPASPTHLPVSGSSPSLARSPQMAELASAVAAENENVVRASGSSSSRSPSRTRLSPSSAGGSGQTPQLLRTRQHSAESTASMSSRLAAESSFAQAVEMIATAKHNGKESVPIDVALLNGLVLEMEDMKEIISALRNKYTGAKRTSQQYSEGLTVAGEEYDKELAMRKDLEAEVSRLRAQVHTQTARLSVISGDERRAESMRRRSDDLAFSLTGLEKDISRLRAERDMTLAEVEELKNSKSADAAGDDAASALSRSLTNRLDTIKERYQEELEPLTAQREALQREIAELRETREQFLEESASLAAKNEELAELNAKLAREADTVQETLARIRGPTMFNKSGRTHPSGSPSLSSLATSATLQEVPEETARVVKVTKPQPIEAAPARRFKWYKSSKGPEVSVPASISKPLALPQDRRGGLQRPSTEFGMREHHFQQHSTMRLTRCELCQEKMWGLQEVRCAHCGMVCHAKCSEKLPRSCTGSRAAVDDEPAAPSMFGRELSEQVIADKLAVPVVVTKCIGAVEVVGMEYEGIYRKTGGASQSKQITQLFERGDYDAFDLADVETFNDISSVTSVLKMYFRMLPNPLLTHALHESFVAAASIPDANNKHSALCELVKKLPKDNYNTLRALMLHLNRVISLSSVNLMTSQNLGVVFGPTLMKSSDPNREFGDMAGKALSVQWMVENAPEVFKDPQV